MFEKWNNYLNESVLHKRIVSNSLTEITIEQLQDFPLNDNELLRIKEWGDLDGDPLFLGSGTMGSAYQFGSKVLKITKNSLPQQLIYQTNIRTHGITLEFFQMLLLLSRQKQSSFTKNFLFLLI